MTVGKGSTAMPTAGLANTVELAAHLHCALPIYAGSRF